MSFAFGLCLDMVTDVHTWVLIFRTDLSSTAVFVLMYFPDIIEQSITYDNCLTSLILASTSNLRVLASTSSGWPQAFWPRLTSLLYKSF